LHVRPGSVFAVTGLGYAFTGTSLRHRLLRGVLRPFIRRALAGDDAWTVVQNDTDRAFLVETFGLAPQRVRLIQESGLEAPPAMRLNGSFPCLRGKVRMGAGLVWRY